MQTKKFKLEQQKNIQVLLIALAEFPRKKELVLSGEET